MVGGAHEWGTLDMAESLLPADAAVGCKLIWMDILHYGIMELGGLEILPDGHHLATRGAEVVHGLQHFLLGFTQSEHNTAFAPDAARGYMADNGERSVVGGHASHLRRETSHGLQIMGDDVGSLPDYQVYKIQASPEVRDEHLHSDFGALFLQSTYHRGPMEGTVIREVVAVDGCYYYMPQTEVLHGVDDILNLLRVEGLGFTP